jgi:hypothetical protein
MWVIYAIPSISCHYKHINGIQHSSFLCGVSGNILVKQGYVLFKESLPFSLAIGTSRLNTSDADVGHSLFLEPAVSSKCGSFSLRGLDHLRHFALRLRGRKPPRFTTMFTRSKASDGTAVHLHILSYLVPGVWFCSILCVLEGRWGPTARQRSHDLRLFSRITEPLQISS